MKKVAGTLRLDLAQFRELAAFAAFGSDLDEATQKQLSKGERLVELLKQDQYDPFEVVDQVAVIYAGVNGLLDRVPVDKIKECEKDLLDLLNTSHSDMMNAIKADKAVSAENATKLTNIINEFVGSRY